MTSTTRVLPLLRGPATAGTARFAFASPHGVGAGRAGRRTLSILVGAAMLLLAASGAPARAALRYPVILPDRDPLIAPAYRGDQIEIQLEVRAAALARGLRAAYAEDASVPRLGVTSVDALGAALGVTAFEPLFRAEQAPPAGSAAPDFTAFYLVHLVPGTDLEAALERFRALADVRTADPVALLPVSLTPDDSLFSGSTWFYQPPLRRDIHAPEAWDLETGDSSVVIAILDTGVLPYHPDLGGTVAGYAGNIWTNTAEANGIPGVDDDGNGFVDDVHGWDFVNTNAVDVRPGEDGKDEDPDPNDFAGHGTAVAGLAAALTNNAHGVAGVAWGTRIMPLRVSYAANADTLGIVEMPFVERALRYAAKNGADVINCSFATLNQAGLFAAARAATAAGALIVAAAGNNLQPHDLATREDVLAVAATNALDQIPSYSNRGDYVDLAAPGGPVYSTFVTRPTPDSLGRRQPSYHTGALLTGTSFSAPLVAGAAALLQSYRLHNFALPPFTPYELIQRLFETTDDIGPDNPGVTGYGSGRLNVWRALTVPGGSTTFMSPGRTVGSPVVLFLPSGARRAVYALEGGRLVFVDNLNQIVANVSVPAAVVPDVAAGDLGMGLGQAVFVTTTGGTISSYDAAGAVRAGWPFTLPGGATFVTGPALADLDADGRLEVVACGSNGGVWAWRHDGSAVTGFPVYMPGAAIAPVALSDLDGVPGAEIAVSNAANQIFVVRGDGTLPAGWPKSVFGALTAPVVTRLGPGGVPRLAVTTGTSLRIYAGDGTMLHNGAISGTPVQNLAVGDIDGAGGEDFVIATSGPATVAVYDSNCVAFGSGWPVALASASSGPPLVAQLLADDPGGRPEVLAIDGALPIALTGAAVRLRTFPRPGRAGRNASVVQLGGDGETQVLGGTSATDSVAYVYDTGPLSASGEASPWFTARGNFSRSGSRLDPPGRPYGLRRVAASESTITLAWRVPGESGQRGRPTLYRVRIAEDAGFTTFRDTTLAAFEAPGAETQMDVTGLVKDTTYWFSVRAYGPWGVPSLESEALEAGTLGVPPGGGHGLALAPRHRPSGYPVEFVWSVPEAAPGGARIDLYDAAGRRLVTLRLAGVEGSLQWDGRDDRGNLVPAGLYFARLVSGSIHTQTRIVLLP